MESKVSKVNTEVEQRSSNDEIDLVDFIIGSEGIYGLVVSCKLGLAIRPKDYLKLFIRLKNEKKAISFHNYLYI